jgi:AcrR family transcriptional regulator
MATSGPLPPPPAFKQQRAARTYEKLLDAAATVFAERGYEATQTPDVAAAAGVSTGALYRYFRDKRHLFIEMLRHHLGRARAEVAARLDPARFAGTEAREAMDTVIDVLFDLVRKNAPLTRVFAAASLTDPDVAALRAATEAEDRQVLARIIGTLVPRDVVPNPEAAAVVLQVATIEIALERAGVRPRSGPRPSDRDVKVALREMFHRYLLPSAPPPVRAGRTPASRSRSRRR